MKTAYPIVVLILLAALHIGCKKKSNDPIAKPQVPGVSVVAGGATVQPGETPQIVYPFTDTFTGTLVNKSFDGYSGTPSDFSQANYQYFESQSMVFYVIHPSADLVIFKSPTIFLPGGVFICDTVAENKNHLYSIKKTNFSSRHCYQVGTDDYDLNHNKLLFNLEYLRDICADFENHSCQFTGIK